MDTAAELSRIERLIRRDRLVAGCGLAALTLLCWAYLGNMASGMRDAAGEAEMHAAMGMPEMGAWGPAQLLALFLMWAVMMVAMMVPSAAPVMMLVLGVYRRRGGREAHTSAWTFIAGYLLVWVAFSAVAAGTQAVLHQGALLSPDMTSRSGLVAGVILVAAGVYQWLPIKNACLTHCRSPLGFLTTEWREGIAGALSMGVRHGGFCVGCCWALMALLFVVGVMNLLWVALIAAWVLVEKLAPRGAVLGRAAGVLLATWGVYILIVNGPR
jgi:predicted metal-binding membrane protein